MSTTTSFTPMLSPQFYLLWKTNVAFNETTYKLTDDQGNVLYTNKPLAANTIYRDTFNLAPGCYEIKFTDSGKDGLSFFANNDGTGYARIMNVGSAAPVKVLEPNFGTSISYRFTVGYMTAINEYSGENVFQLAPNPTHDKVGVNLIFSKKEDMQLYVTNQLGQVVYSLERKGFTQDIIDIDLSNQSKGMYFVIVKAGSSSMTKKLILE